MFKLTQDELQYAYEAIGHHGYSAMLPPAFEWKSVEKNWDEIRPALTDIDLDLHTPQKVMPIFAPKSRANIRVVHLLHPVDLLLYTALVLIIKDDIEAQRITKKARRIYSYRVDTNRPNRLYSSRGYYNKYLDQLRIKSKKTSTSYVAIADIADFYSRIYQHRLENIVSSASTKQRGVDVARVLVRKMISQLMDGNSYGIPVGPYASRILGEAILIDVDEHLRSQNIDYVRWVDDYNIFARSEHHAQSTVFGLAEWLYTKHGLTLQSSKTKILPVDRYIDEIISTPEEKLTDRDTVISILRAAGEEEGYEDEEDDTDLDDDHLEDMLEQLQAFDLELMFTAAISDESLVDYQMVRYVLQRIPRLLGADEELKSRILDLVLDNANVLYPVSEYIARFILSFKKLTVKYRKRIAKKLLNPLKRKHNPPPEYYAMWILYIFSTSEKWNYQNDIVSLYQRSNSETIKRYAALAISKGGNRSNALVVKDDYSSASSLLKLAILSASKKLGKDERKHWKTGNQVRGIVEKHL